MCGGGGGGGSELPKVSQLVLGSLDSFKSSLKTFLFPCFPFRFAVFVRMKSLLAARLKFLGKLQALVYDIPPSTTALFSYAIGSIKLSANEQFLVGSQTVVSVLQTTQI